MRDNRGFTMVELIVVMAILGVLASLALPAFAKIKDKAREVRVMEEIRGLEKGVGAYSIDHGGALPDDGNLFTDLAMPVLLDPWGNAYVYHKITGASDGQARLDPTTTPLNTDYDLYSKGPDGQTSRATDDPTGNGRDDIVRTGNGDYVGMASYP
jgi:general secretion pathway protein G